MDALLVVLTCRRPGGASYLRGSLESLLREGALEADERHVVSDGPLLDDVKLRDDFWNWQFHETGRRDGVVKAHWRALHLAAALGAERLAFFEDDGRPCRNGVRRMLAQEIPKDAAFVSFYDLRELPEQAAHGLHGRPCAGTRRKGIWGGFIASVFPRRTVDYLVGREPSLVSRDDADLALSRLLDVSPWPHYAIHAPTFEHVGDVSTLAAPDHLRRGRNIAGPNFDAESLPAYEEFLEDCATCGLPLTARTV